MNFLELRNIFANDSAELRKFVGVLTRELELATEEIDRAAKTGDERSLRSIKHKLRTSLRLTGGTEIERSLTRMIDKLNHDKQIDPKDHRETIYALEAMRANLQAEKW